MSWRGRPQSGVLVGCRERPRSCFPYALSYRIITFECLAEAEDNLESTIERVLGLGDNKLIVLPDDGPPLGVAQDDPLQSEIFQVLGTDLARIGPKPVVGCILGCDPDVWVL